MDQKQSLIIEKIVKSLENQYSAEKLAVKGLTLKFDRLLKDVKGNDKTMHAYFDVLASEITETISNKNS